MSALLSSPFKYDSSLLEGSVTNVDPIRFVCSVKTVRGQYFDAVPWLLPTGGSGKSGMHYTPNVGDQVVISTALTYPIILGCLPRLGLPETNLTNVSGGLLGVDTGNSTTMRGDHTTNPNKPSDFAPGDHVITTDGGGILAMLANGSSMIKASPLASIFLSKFDDLVRVVARNWERFSDIGQHTVANVKGRMYEFVGWDRSLSRSSNGLYELKDIVGDVAAGEILKGEPNSGLTLPAADTRVRKYSLEDTSGNPMMVEVLDTAGKITVRVSSPGSSTSYSETQHALGLFQANAVVGGAGSVITIVPGSITVDHNNLATVLLDDTHLNAKYSGSVVNLNAAGVQATFGGGVVNIDATGVHNTFGGHFLNVTSAGVQVG